MTAAQEVIERMLSASAFTLAFTVKNELEDVQRYLQALDSLHLVMTEDTQKRLDALVRTLAEAAMTVNSKVKQ